MLGVLGVGVLAFGLTLQDAATGSQGRGGRDTKYSALRVAGEFPVDIPVFRPTGGYSVERVEGRKGRPSLLMSGLDEPFGEAQVADGGDVTIGDECQRALECDDCDPCTEDHCSRGTCDGGSNKGRPCAVNDQCPDSTCTLFGAGLGATATGVATMKCLHFPVPDQQPGECDDGRVCHPATNKADPNYGQERIEVCQGGVCVDITTPCTGGQICDPDPAGTNIGPENTNTRGACAAPCTDCGGAAGDGLFCNGEEYCNDAEVCKRRMHCRGGSADDGGATECTSNAECPGGACTANPCGAGAACLEPTNARCYSPGPDGVCCGFGRCCDYSENIKADCTRKKARFCKEATDAWHATGDCESTAADDGRCGAVNPERQPPCFAGLDPSCPNYSAGIVPRGVYLNEVGPIVAPSPCVVAADDPWEIGDDYEIEKGLDTNEYFKVRTIRWVGDNENFVQGQARYRVSFYNKDTPPQLIVDTITEGTAGGFGLRTVIYGEEPVVPNSGYWAMRAAPKFSDEARFTLACTTAPPDIGTSTNNVWVNGEVVAGTDIGCATGVLAFEIVGVKVGEPTGACCNANTADCDEKLPWECTAETGNVFQGIGTKCGFCEAKDEVNCASDAECNVCISGGRDGEECCPDGDCIAGDPPTCEGGGMHGQECCPAAQGVCAGTCIGGTNPGTPCPKGDECEGGGAYCDDRCASGLNQNQTCNPNADCRNDPGALCVDLFCTGDAPNNKGCVDDLDCQVGYCNRNTDVCEGGLDNGDPCDENIQCPKGEPGNCPGGICHLFLPACMITACCDKNTGDCEEVGSGHCTEDAEGCTSTAGCEYMAGSCVDGRCPNNDLCPAGDDDCNTCRIKAGLCSINGNDCATDDECPTGQCSVTLTACHANKDCSQVGNCSVDVGTPCYKDAECPEPQTCEGSETCSGEHCRAQCPEDWNDMGFGSTCDPNCCYQPYVTGGDNCEDVDVQMINVPTNPQNVVKVTITGNNTKASYPDSCGINIFQPGGVDYDDPGWWEGFSIDACANVRIDQCCTDPVLQPMWAWMTKDCPCASASVGNDVVQEPVGTGEDPYDRGAPYCREDNLWQTFGPLPQGKYFIPVYADPQGELTQYQMGMTFGMCPVAACCLRDPKCIDKADGSVGDQCGQVQCPESKCDPVNNRCLDNPLVECDPDLDCPDGSNCEVCAELNELDCLAADGYWLGPGYVPPDEPPVTSCLTGMCDIGSCCTPGPVCDDRRDPCCECDPGVPSTCMDRKTCYSRPGGKFRAGGLCHFPIEPCPPCEYERADNCQFGLGSEGQNYYSYADKDAYGGHELADDFIPQGSLISGVCVEGVYTEAEAGTVLVDPCGEETLDFFTVTVYANGADDLPNKDDIIGTTTASIATKAPMEGFRTSGINYRIQLSLDTAIPVTPGVCHWISVQNNTVGPGVYPPDHPQAGEYVSNMCHFFWENRINFGEARDGNDYAASKYTKYGDWTPRAIDLAFCLDIPFEAGGCGVREGSCCDNCNAAACTEARTLRDCDAVDPGTSWDHTVDCAGKNCPKNPETDPQGPPGNACATTGYDGVTHTCDTPPPNAGACLSDGSECSSAADCPGFGDGCLCAPNGPILIAAPAGSMEYQGMFTNNCATTDGPNPTLIASGPDDFMEDVWLEYVVPETCTDMSVLTVHMCGTLSGHGYGGGHDGQLAVYHDDLLGGNPKVCACPTTLGDWPKDNTKLWPGNIASDDGCYGYGSGSHGFLQSRPGVMVEPGDCFMIRIGGWEGQQGPGVLHVDCEPFESDCSPSTEPVPEIVTTMAKDKVRNEMNRFLGIAVGGDLHHLDATPLPQSIKVKFVNLPGPYSLFNGNCMWVGTPFKVSEAPDNPGAGKSGYDDFWAAQLQCDKPPATVFEEVMTPDNPVCVPRRKPPNDLVCKRHYENAGQSCVDDIDCGRPILHVFGHYIVPSSSSKKAIYEVRVLANNCVPQADFIKDPQFSPPLIMNTSLWGDVSGLWSNPNWDWSAADGQVQVSIDVIAILSKVAVSPIQPAKARADVVSTTPKVDLSPDLMVDLPYDLNYVLMAATGQGFPYQSPFGEFKCPEDCTVKPPAGVASGR